ncbi:class I SAM-dependent methyltransferase [Daejeonella sp. H1SJ63]|uniref:class I SAM-dependent methyltransferase n=1 Tax=Daejeonella sp. H1SJ63 TaxID=3034145 RepID=UPI0023ED9411|nr:class I SAM-dependent methyltransferase [Daejeonella sp. H1SJ63]
MNKKCYLCDGTEHIQRPGKVRDNPNLDIFECVNCGLVTLSETAIPQNFYELSGMHGDNPLDIDEWLRQLERDDLRRVEYLSDIITNTCVLDFGCGPGGFILKARSKTKQVAGVELESRLADHYSDNNLNVVQNINDLPENQKFDLITAFHVVEHLEQPATILKELSSKLNPHGKIIIEIPSANDVLLTLYNSKSFSEFTYWSCHLFLFNAANLKLLAKKAGLKLDFVDHVQRYPLSNHLHWLSKGAPGGHQKWSVLDSDDLSKAYEARLASLGLTDTLIASFSI